MSEPNLEGKIVMKNEPLRGEVIHQIIGGIRLVLIGIIIIAVVELLLVKQMSLLYPYLNPGLLMGLNLFAIFGYLIPGGLLIGISPYSRYLEPPQLGQIPSIVKILYILSGICACLGILGIRNGVKIFYAFGSKSYGTTSETDMWDEKDAIIAYRWYLFAGGFYLLVFGFVFWGVVELMQVVTIDLAYSDITQSRLVAIEIWYWVCLMTPAFLFFICGCFLGPSSNESIRKKLIPFISLGSILAMCSIFGLSVGFVLLGKKWMLFPMENTNIREK